MATDKALTSIIDLLNNWVVTQNPYLHQNIITKYKN